MTVRSLRFILRAVVMGDSSHFVSMVLIDDQWLFYDGMGRCGSGIRIPKLQVFDRGVRPSYLASFTMSCIFYEVQPIDGSGATLMSKDASNVDQSNEGLTEPIHEQNEDVGPTADADIDDLSNERSTPNNQETVDAQIEDVGADIGAPYDEQDTIDVKIEDISESLGAADEEHYSDELLLNEQATIEDNLSREETIQSKQDTSDGEDSNIIGQVTTQDEYIQQTMNKLRAETANTRLARSKTKQTIAKDPKGPSRKLPTRLARGTEQTVSGFGFVSRVGSKIRCTICKKSIQYGTCAIRYHQPNNGTGRTSHYHTTLACLTQMTLDRQYEFAMKKWMESIPQHLAKGIAENMSKGMNKIVHLKKK
jgi:hypothetical protein